MARSVWMIVVLILKILDLTNGVLIRDEVQPHLYSTRRNDKYADLSTYPHANDLTDGNNNNNNQYRANGNNHKEPRCSSRLETALEQIRRRQQAKQSRQHNGLELEGYSLHQPLRTIPYDMYVTDMRVRLPATNSWVRVDKCQFHPRNKSLETSLLFNDLTISGNVNLYKDDDLKRGDAYRYPNEKCGMILRLRKAGIGFYTEPVRRERGQFNIRTDSHFLEPGFISVYAYGCEPKMASKEHRRQDNIEEKDEISREMEDIFLKGIRSLLTTYMQKELQPAIKQTLMTNLGYTISYGKR